MKYVTAAIPTLVAFGPLFMVMGLRDDWLVLPLIGALMTSGGLLGMFVIQQRAIRRREASDREPPDAQQDDSVVQASSGR